MKANPTVIGAFVVGALVLAVVGVLMFGSGEYFEDRLYYTMFFEDAVDGLTVGSPVKMNGVRIGSVVDIDLKYDHEKQEFAVPITVEVLPDRVGEPDAKEHRGQLQALIQKGLRASLETESMITGQLSIAVDIKPGTPIRLIGGDLPYPEIPTVTSGLKAVFKELEDVEFKALFEEIHAAVQGINELVRSEKVYRAIDSVSETLDEYKKLGGRLNERIDPLVDNVDGTVTEIRGTFAEATATIKNVNDRIDVVATSLDETLASVKKLADSVDGEVKPLSESVQLSLKEMRATVAAAREAAKRAEELLRGDSPTVTNLNRALAEFAAAARSIRALADTLQQQPESLLRGKGGK